MSNEPQNRETWEDSGRSDEERERQRRQDDVIEPHIDEEDDDETSDERERDGLQVRSSRVDPTRYVL